MEYPRDWSVPAQAPADAGLGELCHALVERAASWPEAQGETVSRLMSAALRQMTAEPSLEALSAVVVAVEASSREGAGLAPSLPAA